MFPLNLSLTLNQKTFHKTEDSRQLKTASRKRQAIAVRAISLWLVTMADTPYKQTEACVGADPPPASLLHYLIQ